MAFKSTIENNTRYALLPIVNHDTWVYVERSYAMYWVAGEIERDLAFDLNDIEKLSEGERRLLFMTLSFFATGDYIVNQNLNSSFYDDVESVGNLEAVHFYDYQRMIENVHSLTYSKLLEAYVKDNKEKMELINGIKNNTNIKNKAEWCLQNFGNGETRKSFIWRLIAQACMELISFSGSFCIVFWFAQRNRFKGLKKANELISRDEGLHGIFACHMYKKYKHQSNISTNEIFALIDSFVQIEIQYTKDILPNNLLGMNSELMSQYIKYMANYLSNALDLGQIYPGVVLPDAFAFMEQIGMVRSSDFFKTETTEYKKANTNTTLDEQELVFM
jgi:ribonucleotide reductase beta subunit family protein with ferritin-like domain